MIERLHFHFSLPCTGEGNGNPLQCSCLENPRNGGAWWAAVYGVAQSRTRLKQLSSSSSSSLSLTDEKKSHQIKSLVQVLTANGSESESCSVMSDSLQPHGLYSPWNSPGQNTGVGTVSLLQGIFPTQGLNSRLLHFQGILYQLSYQGRAVCKTQIDCLLELFPF